MREERATTARRVGLEVEGNEKKRGKTEYDRLHGMEMRRMRGGWECEALCRRDKSLTTIAARHNPPRPIQPARAHGRGHRRARRLNITYVYILYTCGSAVYIGRYT